MAEKLGQIQAKDLYNQYAQNTGIAIAYERYAQAGDKSIKEVWHECGDWQWLICILHMLDQVLGVCITDFEVTRFDGALSGGDTIRHSCAISELKKEEKKEVDKSHPEFPPNAVLKISSGETLKDLSPKSKYVLASSMARDWRAESQRLHDEDRANFKPCSAKNDYGVETGTAMMMCSCGERAREWEEWGPRPTDDKKVPSQGK